MTIAQSNIMDDSVSQAERLNTGTIIEGWQLVLQHPSHQLIPNELKEQ
jgi:hypothetical protein